MSSHNTTSNKNNDVLAHLSFETGTDAAAAAAAAAESSLSLSWSRPQPQRSPPSVQQGVLWKRRDVFKNRWRPRWFVLHLETHILTYYLLSPATTRTTTTITNTNQQAPQTTLSNNNSRSRSFSESSSSAVSENTVDYDVVPRGTLYLLGCTVEANEVLTRPQDQLYALTITDHENSSYCHLAARTIETRQRWIQQIDQVCRPGNNNDTGEEEDDDEQDDEEEESPTTTPLRVDAIPEEQVETSLSPPSLEVKGGETYNNNDEWKTVPSPQLTQDLPEELADRIDQLLERHLPLVHKHNPEWKFRYDKDGNYSSTRNHTNPPMIRSIYTTTVNHPIDYLRLLWDLPRIVEFETNISSQKLLKRFNRHTCLVHTAYHRVWPTTARDFASAIHWRLLENAQGKNKALCLLAFSCPQAHQLQPPSNNHIRGTLKISLNLWHSTDGGVTTTHTRILSYDLNGKIPKTLIQTILQQQATLPRIMDLYLQKSKKNRPDSSCSSRSSSLEMEYDSIYTALVEESTSNENNKVHGRSLAARTNSIVVSSSWAPKSNNATMIPIASPLAHPPSLWKETIVLLAPIGIYKFLSNQPFFDKNGVPLSFVNPHVLFLVTGVLAIRWVLLQWMMTHVCLLLSKSNSSDDNQNGLMTTTTGGGTTCCRFRINLKGDCFSPSQLGSGDTTDDTLDDQIMTKAIVLKALHRAMAQHPGLMTRHGFYPILLFQAFYNLDICFHDDDGNKKWLSHVDQQQRPISEMMQSLEPWPTLGQEFFGPSCRVVWTTTKRTEEADSSDDCEGSIHVDWNVPECPIAVAVTDVPALDQESTNSLAISITIQSTNVDACQSFAEQVRLWTQSPDTIACDA